MSMYEDYYRDFCAALWRDEDPARCGCRGRGWVLSDLDTWHQCPIHGKGARHPEDDHGDEVEEGDEVVAPAPAAEMAVVLGDDDLPF